MKALVLEEYNKLVYTDFPDPVIQDDEVLVKIRACGICGSDIHGMDGSTGRRIPPLIMGHEASGDIIQAGAEVKGWKIGDRVTFDSTVYDPGDWYSRNGQYNLSNGRQVFGVSPGEYRRHGAFAEYLAVPAHILYRIPEKVSYYEAAMVEPVAVAAHALNVSSFEEGDKALVVGAGMIGSFVIALLKIAGAASVIAADKDPSKRNLAVMYGADVFLDPALSAFKDRINELTEGRGADIAFDAVGINDSFRTAITSVRRGGSVTIIGNTSPAAELPLQYTVVNQISIQGSCAINGEYAKVLELMDKNLIDVQPMISKIVPLSEGAEWFRKLYSREYNLNKVILVP